MVHTGGSKKMSKEKRYGMNEVDEHGIMNYCEFRKCHWGDRRYDLGGCSTASSGETCYTLYYPYKDDLPVDRFVAYDIHLEETRLNNEWKGET